MLECSTISMMREIVAVCRYQKEIPPLKETEDMSLFNKCSHELLFY